MVARKGILTQPKGSSLVQLHHLGQTDGHALGGEQQDPAAAAIHKDQKLLGVLQLDRELHPGRLVYDLCSLEKLTHSSRKKLLFEAKTLGPT